MEQRLKISLHNSRFFKNRHLKQWNQTRCVALSCVSNYAGLISTSGREGFDSPTLVFLIYIFFFHFHPNCFPSLSYCSSNVAWTQLPGFPLSEAKDNTPTPCQDTLSVPGSLQTGWGGEAEVGVQGGLERVKATGWDEENTRKGLVEEDL